MEPTRYFYGNAWWDKDINDKKAKKLDVTTRPPYKPGEWILFNIDDAELHSYPWPIKQLVGIIYCVRRTEGKNTYEVKVGYNSYGVKTPYIVGRMNLEVKE